MPDGSPTSRALLVLELIQDRPGITADRLAERLGVSDRAVRRCVATLREADVPIESERGRYGGYRLGRGFRLPPLTFTPTEALALVMAVLEAHRGAGGTDDPVDTALDKLVRVLPRGIGAPVEAVRAVGAADPHPGAVTPDPVLTAALVQAGDARRRVRLTYRRSGDPADDRVMEVDPWAVVVRRGRWFLLCWSHAVDAVRTLRVDRVTSVVELAEPFEPPDGLDAMRALEDHLAQGWGLPVEIEVHAPPAAVAHWVSRSLGRLEPIDHDRTLLVGSTDDVEWYAAQLTAVRVAFRVLGPPQLQVAVAELGRLLVEAGDPGGQRGGQWGRSAQVPRSLGAAASRK